LVIHPAISLAVAAGLTALALADGGYPPEVLGIATVTVWVLATALLFGRWVPASGVSAPFALALALVVALALWAVASFAWAGDDAAAFAAVVRVALYAGLLALVGIAARPGSGPSWLVGIALGGSVIAAVALGSRLIGFGADQELARALPLAGDRLSFPLGYWNGLGYLLAMTLAALAWLVAAGRPLRARLALAATVPVALALFLTSSRGAAVAAAFGVAVIVVLAADRRRLLLAAGVALPAWLIVVVVAAAGRGELDPAVGLSVLGVALTALTVALAVAAFVGFGRLLEREPRVVGASAGRGRWIGRRGRLLAAGGIVVLVAVVAALGPAAFVGEFRTETAAGPRAEDALVSGSGRSSFWRTALDAFAERPLRGVGAGGYESYWNANGELSVPTRSAHSTPLQTLAELGLPGALILVALLALTGRAGARAVRGAAGARREPAGAVVAIAVIGTIAIAIDWTWELPAAVAPLVIVVGLLLGRGLEPSDPRPRRLLVDPWMVGYEPIDRLPGAPPPWAVRVVYGGLALAAVWAGLVLTIASIHLNRSSDRLAEGELAGAAESARAAAEIQPWSVEPSLRLAEIERAGANLDAARRRAEDAARRSPVDFRPWLLLSGIQLELGNLIAAGRYLERARTLAPRVLDRAGTTRELVR
jgi:hypothetical protein